MLRKFKLYSQFLFCFLKNKNVPPPKLMTVEITWNCNLNCPICPRQNFKINKEKNMPLEDFKTIIEKIPSVIKVNFYGLGEPLMHPEFFEILNFLEKRKILVEFTTNGILLSEKNIKRLPKNIHRIYFSIDTSDREIYKEIRGYEISRVLKNISLVKKFRKNVKVVIQALAMSNTIHSLCNLIDIAKMIGAKVVLIYPIAFSEEMDILHPHNLKNCKKLLEKIERYAREKRVELVSRPSTPKVIKRCTQPWTGPTISVRGEIFPCCYIYEARGDLKTPAYWKEVYRGYGINVPMNQYKFGNLFEVDFNEIWNGEEYFRLRSLISRLHSKKELSPSEFNLMRKSVNLDEKFSYCKICLSRWGCAC